MPTGLLGPSVRLQISIERNRFCKLFCSLVLLFLEIEKKTINTIACIRAFSLQRISSELEFTAEIWPSASIAVSFVLLWSSRGSRRLEKIKLMRPHQRTFSPLNGMTPLAIAADRGDVLMVETLVALAGADPNLANSQTGLTPLHYAARNDDLLMIK